MSNGSEGPAAAVDATGLAPPRSPSPTPDTAVRAEILGLHQALFERQRALIREHVRGYTPGFKRYEGRFARRVSSFERLARIDEVAQAALASDVVHVGDYHTLKQAQRAFVKLVRRLAERGREVVLALEFVEARHQVHVDRFLAGKLSEARFLERIGYPGKGFEVWPHFRPIFDTARGLGLPIVALERAGGGALEVRDAFFARRIARTLRERPGALVVALVGQLHCAPPHLPAEVAKALKKGPAPRQLVVYQNAEAVYWALERQGHEHDTEAVLVREGEYCLVNTSPLVAQQSYLDWVEGEGELVETTQPERHFKELARLIAEFLDLEIGDALDRVEVYTAGDLSFLPRLRETGLFSRHELQLIKRQILGRESYYIPRAHIAYLANLSINHAAEEAAHFLRHVVTGEEEPERGLIDGFYGRALEEALAFFGSKIVNHRRRAPHVEEFEKLRRSSSPGERRVAELVLAHKELERGRPRHLRRFYAASDVDVFNAVTHGLGYILGDQLYYALVRGIVSKEEAREYFVDALEGDGDAFHLYFHLARRVGRVRVPRHG